jgi:hypothetical protein
MQRYGAGAFLVLTVYGVALLLCSRGAVVIGGGARRSPGGAVAEPPSLTRARRLGGTVRRFGVHPGTAHDRSSGAGGASARRVRRTETAGKPRADEGSGTVNGHGWAVLGTCSAPPTSEGADRRGGRARACEAQERARASSSAARSRRQAAKPEAPAAKLQRPSRRRHRARAWAKPRSEAESARAERFGVAARVGGGCTGRGRCVILRRLIAGWLGGTACRFRAGRRFPFLGVPAGIREKRVLCAASPPRHHVPNVPGGFRRGSRLRVVKAH